MSNAETELTSAAGSGNIYWNVFGGLPPREDIRRKCFCVCRKMGVYELYEKGSCYDYRTCYGFFPYPLRDLPPK